MRLTVIAIGRARGGTATTLFQAYSRRLRWQLQLIEVDVAGRMSAGERRTREGTALLGKVPPNVLIVTLDQGGTALTSEALAARIKDWRDGGRRDIVFLIGGAEGHDARVVERADLVLSLGPMTWPHLLVRGMLAEQLFRSECLLTGHPYHRQ
jgi:23S rRNA (pseudouridine1915-N3)-methyltransferase